MGVQSSGTMAAYINHKISVDSDDEMLESVYGPDVLKSPEAALMQYRNEHCGSNKLSCLD